MTRPEPTDAALVARVRRGDEAAFALIDARYRAPLRGFARRLLGGRGELADDVVQEALWRAYRALTADDRPIELRPWLHRIVRNLCFDEHRRPAAEPVAAVERLRLAEDPSSVVLRRERLT